MGDYRKVMERRAEVLKTNTAALATNDQLNMIKQLRNYLCSMKTLLDNLTGMIRGQCKHPAVEYEPDPSGNNDWSNTCLICAASGKQVREEGT